MACSCNLQGDERGVAAAIPYRSVIFSGPEGMDIIEPASVASCRGSEIRFFREDTVKFDGLRFDENLSR